MTHTSMTPRITPEILADLCTWEGRSESREEVLCSAPAGALAATLDRPDLMEGQSSTLPPLWHWLYFLPQAPQSELGADGHPRTGGFLPPVPLPRRMWAGGRITWHAPIQLGERLRKTTTIVSVRHKSGRSGDLVFLVLRHVFTRAHGVSLITEEQDLVYRAPAQPGDPAPQPQAATADAMWSRTIVPDPVLLFRYSALTFNGHRIHYDRPYATDVEGYGGLVVHGPLIATLLADLVSRELSGAQLRSFSFRAVRPLLDLNAFQLCGKLARDGKQVELWSRDHEGWLTMQAQAALE
ncbi:MAG: acyl-CoA dehydrogenase [Rhodoferax sp.]|nr:acyl-CoA dehydrogenase [Rhodoferax sp.]